MARKKTGGHVGHTDAKAKPSPRTKSHVHVFYTVRLMTFVNWIAPPIGFDMSGIDPTNNYYSIGIMNVSPVVPGPHLSVPFAQVIQPPPGAQPSSFYPFPMTGVQTLDPYGLQYYWAANVSLPPPGGAIWSRVFLPPQLGPLTGLPDGTPAGISVANVPLLGGGTATIAYHHVIVSSLSVPPPADFYLQQPLP
jgi:hypothetical protein